MTEPKQEDERMEWSKEALKAAQKAFPYAASLQDLRWALDAAAKIDFHAHQQAMQQLEKQLAEMSDANLKMMDRYDCETARRVDVEEAMQAAQEEKDGAYLERNRLVALLARLFPSGIAKTAIEGWSEDWHGCVYIDLPTGQASWHYHDSQAYLFEGLPPYAWPWDGHTTEEKYQRIGGLVVQLHLNGGEIQDERRETAQRAQALEARVKELEHLASGLTFDKFVVTQRADRLQGEVEWLGSCCNSQEEQRLIAEALHESLINQLIQQLAELRVDHQSLLDGHTKSQLEQEGNSHGNTDR